MIYGALFDLSLEGLWFYMADMVRRDLTGLLSVFCILDFPGKRNLERCAALLAAMA